MSCPFFKVRMCNLFQIPLKGKYFTRDTKEQWHSLFKSVLKLLIFHLLKIILAQRAKYYSYEEILIWTMGAIFCYLSIFFNNTDNTDLNQGRNTIIYCCLLDYFLSVTQKIKHNQFQMETLLCFIKDKITN